MNSDLLNVSNIECFFDELLGGKVSENVFYTNLPKVMDKSWKDMVLVDVGSAVEDMNAYGSGIVNIFLYSQPLPVDYKNVPHLSDMEMILNRLIRESNDEHYRISRATTYTDYDEERNLHTNIVSVKLVIV